MPESPTIELPEANLRRHSVRRAPWRQRLVDAERGVTHGFRADSALFVHFFVSSLIVVLGLGLGLSTWQWLAVVGSIALVFSAEFLNQALRELLQISAPQAEPAAIQRFLQLGMAAVGTATLGSAIIIGTVFWLRVSALFAVSAGG